MTAKALPCIVCGKYLEHVFPDISVVEGNQPNDGTAFYSKGHYYSTFWDPMDGTYIEINICDECLTDKKDKILFPEGYNPDNEDEE